MGCDGGSTATDAGGVGAGGGETAVRTGTAGMVSCRTSAPSGGTSGRSTGTEKGAGAGVVISAAKTGAGVGAGAGAKTGSVNGCGAGAEGMISWVGMSGMVVTGCRGSASVSTAAWTARAASGESTWSPSPIGSADSVMGATIVGSAATGALVAASADVSEEL